MDNKIGKGTEKRIKFFVAAAIVVIAMIAVAVICITAFSGGLSSKGNIVVYKNSNGFNVRIGNLETVVSDSTSSDFKCDKKNNRVF